MLHIAICMRRDSGDRRYPRLAVALVIALAGLVSTACGGDKPTVTPGAGAVPTGPSNMTPTVSFGEEFDYPSGEDDLILLIDVTGQIGGTRTTFFEPPWLAVYGGGRVITQGPVIAIYPPPALPNLQEGRLSPDGIQALLRAASDAGLMDGDASYQSSDAEDAYTTTFVVTSGGTTTRVVVYGLEDDDLPETTSPEEAEARKALRVFRQQVVDYRSLVPEGSIEQEEQPYVAEHLQLLIVPASEPLVPVDPSITPGTAEWPLDISPAEFGEAMEGMPNARCGVVEGDDLEEIRSSMQHASLMTVWESEAGSFAVYPRPLLPHEGGCASGE